MKGSIFKFRLDDETINNDMDNFLFNIVKNRQRNQLYLTKGRVAFNTLEENDYIFIQSNGKITHYMKCNSQGPKKYDKIEISVKDIEKLEIPIRSIYKGQGYNKLSEEQVIELLINIYIMSKKGYCVYFFSHRGIGKIV